MQIPAEAVMAAATAIERELLSGKDYSMAQDSDEALARVALEAAAPILAEAWKPKRAAAKPKREVLPRCYWCGKHNRTASDWEQKGSKDIWQRLCVRCANKRLDGRNLWSALLPMRKVGSEEKESEHA